MRAARSSRGRRERRRSPPAGSRSRARCSSASERSRPPRGAFEFGEPRTVEAKGKPGGVVGRAGRSRARLMRPRGVGGPPTGVRRPGQRARPAARDLPPCGGAVPSRTSSTIVGEPGVGKTRLVRRASGDASPSEEPAPIGADGPLSPVRRRNHVLAARRDRAGALRAPEGDPPSEVLERLEGREILGLALGLDVAPELHPLDARERLHAAAVAVRRGARPRAARRCSSSRTSTGPRPICSISSSDRLGCARARSSCSRTARPELLDQRPTGAPDSGTRPCSGSSRFPTTTPRACSTRCSRRRSRTTCASFVVERAEGNPFFLEELVGELVDSGVLERDGRAPGRSRARSDASRCRTPCTQCSPRASTGCRRPRRRHSRPPPSSGACSGQRPSSICSTASSRTSALLEERDLVAGARGVDARRRSRVRDQARPHA